MAQRLRKRDCDEAAPISFCLTLGLALLGCADDRELGSELGGELDDSREHSIVVELEGEMRIHGELTVSPVSVEPGEADTFVVYTDRLVFDGAQWGDSRIYVEDRYAPRDKSQNDGPALIPFFLYTRASEGQWKPLELEGGDSDDAITPKLFWDAELSPRSNTLEDRHAGELTLSDNRRGRSGSGLGHSLYEQHQPYTRRPRCRNVLRAGRSGSPSQPAVTRTWFRSGDHWKPERPVECPH
jgi:hypothetical protein